MSRFSLLALSLALMGALPSCVSSHSSEPSLVVHASISSATLADECTDADDEPTGLTDCAEGESDCGFCRQTSVHLDIAAEGDEGEVPFEVVEIRLVSLADGSVVDTLSPGAAEVFDEDLYTDWDETIGAGEALDVRYPTEAPDWGTIGGGDSWRTHGMQFRIEMRVRIDGVERDLSLEPVSREAEIVT